VLFFDFKNDVRNEPRDSADLYDLIEQFKVKVNYPRQDALECRPGAAQKQPEHTRAQTASWLTCAA
jgi:hypothetical protein